ncbi:YncE family protein [Luteimonas sp. 3794]|uniref:Vgb family protein n=1 Tax=Luteimonas sp. 3794 TaxID=2817730 RepID=UPI00285B6C4D|nr:YncE family protein [Luteimonas sp. 3794]MDR6993054.1 DNA-binding beta-propeller fold protein YncE [Luteimonas sp. 3794]
MQKLSSRRLRLAALSIALCAAVGAVGAQGFGQPDPDFKGAVRAASPVIKAGDSVDMTGQGFKPGQAVTLLRGETVLNARPWTADAEGRVSGQVQVPADAAVGRHPVVVRVANPDAAAVIELKVSKDVPLSGAERYDVTTNKLVQGLYQVAHSQASNALFVTAAVGRPPVSQSELLKLDPETLEITARVTPAQIEGETNGRVYAVYGVAVDDANGNVWVTNTRDDTVAVYRQSDLSLVKQFDKGVLPHGRDIVVDTKDNRVWASGFGGGKFVAFDAKTLEVVQDLTVPSGVRGEEFGPMALTVDPVGGKLYSVGLSTGEVVVLDGATGAVDKMFRFPTINGGIGVAIDPVGRRLYVTAQGSDNLVIANADTGEVLHDVYVGAGAVYVAFDPHSQLAYVASRGAGTITAVDANGTIVANLDGGTFPNHVLPVGNGTVYAINKSRGAEDVDGDQIRRITPKTN